MRVEGEVDRPTGRLIDRSEQLLNLLIQTALYCTAAAAAAGGRSGKCIKFEG